MPYNFLRVEKNSTPKSKRKGSNPITNDQNDEDYHHISNNPNSIRIRMTLSMDKETMKTTIFRSYIHHQL